MIKQPSKTEQQRRAAQSARDKAANHKKAAPMPRPKAQKKPRKQAHANVRAAYAMHNLATEARALAAAIAMPASYMRRLPQGDMQPTDLVRSLQSNNYRGQVGGNKFAGDEIEANTGCVHLLGQPGLSHVLWKSFRNIDGNKQAGYALLFLSGDDGVRTVDSTYPLYDGTYDDMPFAIDPNIGQLIPEPQVWPIVSAASQTALANWASVIHPASGGAAAYAANCVDAHGAYMPIGVFDHPNQGWVFMNRGDCISIMLDFRYANNLGTTGEIPNQRSFTVLHQVTVHSYDATGPATYDAFSPEYEFELLHSPLGQEFTFRAPLHYFQAKQTGFYRFTTTRLEYRGNVGATSAYDSTAQTIRMLRVRLEARLQMNCAFPIDPNLAVGLLEGAWIGTAWPHPNAAGPGIVYSAYWALQNTSIFDVKQGGDPELAKEVRTNAVSLLLTNTSPALSMGGVFRTARLRGTPFYQVTNAKMAATAGYRTMPQAKGLYTFLLPEDQRLRLTPALTPASDYGFYAGSTLYRLPPLFEDHYHTIVIPPIMSAITTASTTSDSGAPEYPAQFRLTVDEVFEFVTTNRRYHPRTATDAIQSLLDARAHFKATEDWFYENPSHVARIYSWLRGMAERHGDKARKFADLIDPRISRGYDLLMS